MKFPIRTKLILAICLPLLAVYLTVLAIEYRLGKAQAIAQMRERWTEATAHLADEVDKDLSVACQTARNAAASLGQFPLREAGQIDALLSANVRDTPSAFGSAAAFEPRAFDPGRERFARYACRSAKGPGLIVKDVPYDYFRWDWYRLPRESRLPREAGQPVWTEPYFDRGAGDILMCTCSVPFYRDKEFRGVATVDVSLEDLREELRKASTGEEYCTIVSRTGTFISHPDQSRIMADSVFRLAERSGSEELAKIGREMTAGKTGVRRLTDAETGKTAWIVFVPIESVGWSLAAVIPESQVMAGVYWRLNRHAAMLLGGLAAIVLVVMVVAAWITRPIARLAVAAHELAKGNLEVQVPSVGGRDEVGEFAHTFSAMVRDLKGNVEQRIRETAARESLQHELQVARRLQTSLLPMARPPFPGRTEFSLDAHNEPAKIMAGDFFDFWLVSDDVLALVVADVSGKGAAAAMFMAVARTILRSFPAQGQSPAQVLAMANRIIAADNKEQMFVTVFFAHYRVRTGELVFAIAGHNPPYVVRVDGAAVSLGEATGPILGVFEDAQFADRRERLAAGDVLVAYTDGVTEAMDAQGVMFGDERLQTLLSTIHNEPVEAIRRRILEEVTRHRQGQDQDDVTVLVLRRNE